MSERRLSWLVFACSVLPRIAALCYFGLPGPTYYYYLSGALLHGGTLSYGSTPTTYMEPLYPAVLAVLRWLARDHLTMVILGQIGMAGIAAVLLFRLTRHLSGSTRAALVAAAFYAFYPYLVRQSAAYLAMNLHVPLLIAATWQFVRIDGWRRAACCGALFGLVFLTRASLLPVAIAALALLWTRRQRREFAALAVSAACIVVPWTVRCLSVDGSVLPTRIGENLYVSMFPLARGYVPRYDVDLLLPLVPEVVGPRLTATRMETDLATDSMYLSLAISRALEDPWRVVRLKARNFAYVWVPRLVPIHMKDARTYARIRNGRVVVENLVRRPVLWEVLHSTAAAVLRLAALAGIVLRWRRRGTDALLLWVLTSVILVQTVFFPTTRLLVPMLFVLMFYAACAIDRACASIGWPWAQGRPAARS